MSKFEKFLSEEMIGKAVKKKVVIKDATGKIVDEFDSNAEAYEKYRMLPKGYTKETVSK